MYDYQLPRILVVDDDRILCELTCELLQENKFITDYALSGSDAIKKVKEQKYNLVILDFYMPGMPGEEALVEMKKVDPTLPVIMISPPPEPSIIVKSIKLGADDFVTKPFDYDELLNSIINHCRILK